MIFVGTAVCFLLEQNSQLNYNKSESIFSHASITVWNDLPLDIWKAAAFHHSKLN